MGKFSSDLTINFQTINLYFSVMKTIKANYESSSHFVSYEVNGEYFEGWGEFFFNKKKNRYEHEHIGKRGGKYLIVW